MAGISLWVVFTYLFTKEPWRLKSCTGWNSRGLSAGWSIDSQSVFTRHTFRQRSLFHCWQRDREIFELVHFLENLDPRLLKAWNKWMIGIGPTFDYVFLGGLISVLFYRKVSQQKCSCPCSLLALAVAILMDLATGQALPRIWIYLEAFYLMFAAAGLVWLMALSLRVMASPTMTERILSLAIPWRSLLLPQHAHRSCTKPCVSRTLIFCLKPTRRITLPGL